jgi:predicted O-methyltransferase YrrM
MRDLAVLIPTRGRPGNVRKVISAWDFTNAWDRADMVLVIDRDDPEYPGYLALVEETSHPDTGEPLIKTYEVPAHVPMVHKLNDAARALAPGWFALGFAGDDHLPQTIGWAARYLTVLRELGSGMVYGDDGYQGRKLSTEWAVTSDVVRVLDRMVPADVEHMYCDNAMMDLFGAAGALRHLPEVRIEHMHPVAGKAASDDQYKRVNHRDQFTRDRRAYESWRHGDVFRTDVAEVRHLRKGRPEVTTDSTNDRASRVVGSGPRPVAPRQGSPRRREVERSGPTSARGNRPPRWFKNVRGATPEDVMVALADLASQVPADQEIVELGVFQGRSALQLAWGASQGHGAHVTAVDAWDLEGNTYDAPFTDPDSRVLAHTNIQSLGYADKIRLVQNFASDEAARYDGPPVGLLFVDDDHSYAGARRAVEDWAPHLAPGATIAVDDYGHPDWPGVAMAVDDLVNEGVLEPIEIHGERLAVTRLSTGKRETPAAITSVGVSPSPYPAVGGQVADGPEAAPEKLAVEPVAAESDSEVSSHGHHGDLGRVGLGEALVVDGTTTGQPVQELKLDQLRALAKHRGIVLGQRKDKKAEIVQALRDGR